MSRHVLVASALSLLTGCATASPAVVKTTVAREGAFECVKGVLTARGYEMRHVDASAQLVEAEARRAHWPDGAVREIVLATVEPGPDTTSVLKVQVRAFDYREAEHNLPISRQTVHEIRPSAPVATDADQLLRSCGIEESERFGRGQAMSRGLAP